MNGWGPKQNETRLPHATRPLWYCTDLHFDKIVSNSTPTRPSEISEKKLELKGKVIFDILFTIQSHVESMNKILGAL